MIEQEQAPLVGHLREAAEARGEDFGYWCVVSFERWGFSDQSAVKFVS